MPNVPSSNSPAAAAPGNRTPPPRRTHPAAAARRNRGPAPRQGASRPPPPPPPPPAPPRDVPLIPGNKRDDFVAAALREVGIEPVPMEGFAVWVAKLKPLLQ